MTQKELDEAVKHGCQNPDCDHSDHSDILFLTQKCHPGAGVDCCYESSSGLLHVCCHKCEDRILSIKVSK